MFKRLFRNGKTILVLFVFIILILLFLFRDDFQPFVLFLRKHVFILLLVILVLGLGLRYVFRSTGFGSKLIALLSMSAFFGLLYFLGWYFGMYNYMVAYSTFTNTAKIEIQTLPTTKNERIQPLNNIISIANESVGETKDVSEPHLVRIDNQNRWTMAIQPSKKYVWQRINSNTEELFSVSSTSPFPRFANQNRIPVTFSIGETLKFSRNTYNAVIQRFNILQYITLQPSDVFYMKNDKQEWVQVVSLIKWKGFFFPYPTFGGVMVINNGKHTASDYLERLLIGKGTYIAPDELENYSYLKGQNLLSETVSRMQAQSLKFLGGFSDPLPWNMESAVTIPDLPADQNQQPFIVDFDFDKAYKEASNGLYHWFGLEPIGNRRANLAISVFIPADGSGTIYYYNHALKKEGLSGVTAMPLKIIESRKEYDWTANRPVEFRPYIKDLAGRTRMFFLGTVTSVNSSNTMFDGTATPDIAIIDSEYRDVVWVDAKHPDSWEEAIYRQLNEAWRASEGIEHYFIKEEPTILYAQKLLDSIKKLPQIDPKAKELQRLEFQIDSIIKLKEKIKDTVN